jgi:DNA-binding PadR family transcriptional regulator
METTAVLKTMHRRLIKNFSDILILAELRKGPLSGYDVIEYINNKFHILLSSGTVYAILYSLERDGLITGNWNQRRRMYNLTQKGEDTLKAILITNTQVEYILSHMLKLEKNS